MKNTIGLILVSIALAACTTEDKSPVNQTEVADVELVGNNGEVLSVIQVTGYTYIEVQNSGRRLWLAANPVEVSEGDIISWGQFAVMRDFKSQSLDRTFDEILFVSAIYPGPDPAPAPVAVNNVGIVRSTESASGYTYAEILTDNGENIWLAVPSTQLSEGDRVTWQGGSLMTDFTSNSLDRTFPEIFFVSALAPATSRQ